MAMWNWFHTSEENLHKDKKRRPNFRITKSLFLLLCGVLTLVFLYVDTEPEFESMVIERTVQMGDDISFKESNGWFKGISYEKWERMKELNFINTAAHQQ